MTRVSFVSLSSLAVAAVLCASADTPAAREPILPKKPKEIVVVGSKAAKQPPKALSGQQRKQRLYPAPTCPQCSIKKN
jgi:hypothetical protein